MLLVDIIDALKLMVLMVFAQHSTITTNRFFASFTEIHQLQIMDRTELTLVFFFEYFAIFPKTELTNSFYLFRLNVRNAAINHHTF